MANNDLAVSLLLDLLAVLFATIAAIGYLEKGGSDRRAAAVASLAAALLLLGVFWRFIESRLTPPLVHSASAFASDIRVWFGVLILFWLYGAAVLIMTLLHRNRCQELLENDIQALRTTLEAAHAALERWVVPRRLTPEQTHSIAQHLGKFPPFTVIFAVTAHNAEAAGYAGDLMQAFKNGGWSVRVEHRGDIPQGLSHHYQHLAVARSGLRSPFPNRIVAEAFAQANVSVDGSGTDTGRNVTQELFTVRVGGRPRNGRLRWPERPIEAGQV
jgi:membrane protease YdiL (CAAX protease family)